MRSLIILAIISVAAAKPKPGGLYGAPALSSYSLPVAHQSLAVAPAPVFAQPLVHAAPAVIAKPAATSYASFQQIVHPVAQQVVHAPVISQPIVHAPVVSQPIVQAIPQPIVHAAPVVQTISQPLVHGLSLGSLGHGW